MQWLTPIQLPPTKQAHGAELTPHLECPAAPPDETMRASDSFSSPVDQYSQDECWIRRLACRAQHILESIEDSETDYRNMQALHVSHDDEDEGYARTGHYIQNNRRVVESILEHSGEMTADQLVEAWQQLTTGMKEMLGIDDDDLEEGEIREGSPNLSSNGYTSTLDPEGSSANRIREALRWAGTRMDRGDEEDDLEDGEIREEDPFALIPDSHVASAGAIGSDDPQELPPISLYNDPYQEDYLLSTTGNTARSSQCPLCRKLAFDNLLQCHNDTVQLIRVRLRLSDLAYAIFNFDRSHNEDMERNEIKMFLERRYNDNVALGEQEITPSVMEYRRIFTQARRILRQQAYDYLRKNRLPAAEQLHVIQLATVFENLKLKAAHVPFFFDEHPTVNDHIWKMNFSAEDMRALNEDPKTWFNEIDIVPISTEDGDTVELGIQVIAGDGDDEMADAMEGDEDADSVNC